MLELSGRYRLIRLLGEGGMGIVHEAIDLQLHRRVAIKMIRESRSDATSHARFIREARAAASISHPNACQLHEIGEHQGQPFLVMELLDGDTLAARLLNGPLAPDEAAALMLPVLSALQALHARGLVHRDLKPSNVFITQHGVKLLDFGLARQVASFDGAATEADVTMPGTLTGTPRYMAPEQLAGDAVDARTDVYAAGVLFYELLTGHTPFQPSSAVQLLRAMLHDSPPPLTGPASIFDPIVQRALSRTPSERYAAAAEMAAAVRAETARSGSLSGSTAAAARVEPLPAPPAIKLVVLPFRVLRPDDEVAFLEVALPDAITTSLSSVRSLCVRSPLAAARFTGATDLPRVASELDVNHVLTGTLLRVGDQLRVTCQLVEAPGGRVCWSQTLQMALGDLFQLQDSISRQIVESLPIETSTASTAQDVPSSSHAYELYLRANILAQDNKGWRTARSLYEACLAEDPMFAPAWARLGRMHRVIGKYLEIDYHPSYEAAERAFQRAFELSPDLSLAHHLYVYQEVEMGRADAALLRLVTRITRQPQQAELFAALCQAARYCGLLDVSLAAYERARRLDPQVRTSVPYTHMMLGDYKAMLASSPGETDALLAFAYMDLGATTQESVQVIETEAHKFPAESAAGQFTEGLRFALLGQYAEALEKCRQVQANRNVFPDGEGIYQVARVAVIAGDVPLAIDIFDRAVDMGFFCVPGFERDHWMHPLRDETRFQIVMQRARARYVAAEQAFAAAGGYRLLDLSAARRVAAQS